MRPLLLTTVVVLVVGSALASPGGGGGWRKVQSDDLEVQKVVSFCMEDWGKELGDTPLTFERIVSAYAQVVAGMNYRVTVEARAAKELVQREFIVWDHFGTLKLTKKRDVPPDPLGRKMIRLGQPRTGTMVGGWRSFNVHDPHVAKAANFCLDKLNEKASPSPGYALQEIVSAKVQVVAGLKYKMVLRAARRDAPDDAIERPCEVYDHFGEMSLIEHK